MAKIEQDVTELHVRTREASMMLSALSLHGVRCIVATGLAGRTPILIKDRHDRLELLQQVLTRLFVRHLPLPTANGTLRAN